MKSYNKEENIVNIGMGMLFNIYLLNFTVLFPFKTKLLDLAG